MAKALKILLQSLAWWCEKNPREDVRCGAAFWLRTPHEALAKCGDGGDKQMWSFGEATLIKPFLRNSYRLYGTIPTLRCALCGVANQPAAPQR